MASAKSNIPDSKSESLFIGTDLVDTLMKVSDTLSYLQWSLGAAENDGELVLQRAQWSGMALQLETCRQALDYEIRAKITPSGPSPAGGGGV